MVLAENLKFLCNLLYYFEFYAFALDDVSVSFNKLFKLILIMDKVGRDCENK